MKKEKMENGKRIEFKGIAKIVILAIVILMITGITAIEATAFSVGDCPDCSESGLAFSSAESWERKNDFSCFYYSPIADGYSGRIYVCKYNSLSQAISDFESVRKYRNPNRKIIILKDSHTEFIFIVHDGIPPDIAIHGHFLDIEKKVKTKVIMEVDIHGQVSDSDIAEAKDRFQAFAKCANKIITGLEDKEEYTLTLEHYPLYPYLEESKELAFRSAEAPIGGDLRATLKNKYGEGKSNVLVYFYVEKDTPLHWVLTDTMGAYYHWEEVRAYLDNVDFYSYIGAARTDSEGIASFNYISKKSIIPNVLMNKLVKHNGKVNGTVKAVVMKPHGEVGWEIEHEASVPVKFECIAKIMKIEGKGVLDKLPIGKRQGTISGPGQVRVQRGLFQPNLDLNTSQKEGFELMPADIINIDGDTSIEIVWINGDRAKLIVPETVGVKEDQPVGSINFILASSAYDSGFYTRYEDLVDSFGGVTYEKGINMMLDTIKDMVPGLSTAEKSYEFVVEIIEKTKKVDISQVSILTKIRIRSKVIIDSAGDEICVYNIEGSPDIKTVKGEEVTLADKEMVAIAENGSLSEVQSFDPEEVLNEFFDTLNGSITIKAETASTVERETVKLTVMGVAGDPIRVESSPLSDNVLFKDGIDDTPTGANYHVNWFTDTIDADGIRRYAVEFNDMGIYTIKATVTGGDREGDSDTVEITVLEKEVPLDLPAPIPSELEISKLYVGKSVYPRGTEVDVYYDVKNIGTVDVDEYYVECRINDLKGNEMYKFVGSARSIASGEQQKFVAAEKWKIPSDAKTGPYKITATVKWDSRTHTKTTNEELFVTIATISENSKAELEISELYTLKKEYSKNEKVKMCYCVKNIGSKKVKQYHIRCAFINPNGEKFKWFTTAPFSIAGKDKKKWCLTEELATWKIPSDAEQGTYTIEVTVIWGSKIHTKTTDFKVK